MTELLQFRTVLSVWLISLHVQTHLCLNRFSFRIETFNEFLSEVNLYNFERRESRRSLPPTFVWNKSYKYEPEFIPLSTTVINVLSTTDGLGSSRRNRLCRDAVEAVILAYSLVRRGLSLGIIRFYSERLSRNFIGAFDCITVTGFTAFTVVFCLYYDYAIRLQICWWQIIGKYV